MIDWLFKKKKFRKTKNWENFWKLKQIVQENKNYVQIIKRLNNNIKRPTQKFI